jgi:hypothetical protein
MSRSKGTSKGKVKKEVAKTRNGPSIKAKGKAQPARLSLPMYGTLLMIDPDLMEIEVRYIRDWAIEIKALVDIAGTCTVKVIHQKYAGGKLIYDEIKLIPYHLYMGSQPASDDFNSIVMGEI